MEQAHSDDPVFHRIAAHQRKEESDAAFAERIGLNNPQTFSRWKLGKSDPTDRETLVTVAENLDISLDWLLRGEGEPSDHPNRPAIAGQLRKVIEWIEGEAVDWEPTSGDDLPVGEIDTLGDDARAAGGD